MKGIKSLGNLAGWVVFIIATIVYYLSVERTGSLWDCGEFILGAYKLQVVHPPGAPLFLLVGRLFTWVAEIFSSNPEDIAFSVNMMSGICTAFAATFVSWTAVRLGKLAMVGREGELEKDQEIAVALAGLVAGLTTAFCTSIWFSAVEGEVYAMSTFFTTLTFWSMIKWYSLPDTPQNDRWLVFTVYAAGLSIGVHLLSLLTFPALALFYYFKKYKETTFLGMAAAAGAGVAFIVGIQVFIILGIPKLWSVFELFTVNSLGLPFHSGIVPTMLVVGAVVYLGLRYAKAKQNALMQMLVVAATMVVIGFSTIGIVVIRANASPPINMNAPSDAMRLIPYLNREQYGERALLRGPAFEAQPIRTSKKDRYGRVGDKYEIVDYKVTPEYRDSDKMMFPRMSDNTQGRPTLYKRWMGLKPDAPLPSNRPNQSDNVSFFVRYQLYWMYFRYFMWNFSGRQNGEQGYEPWDKSSGHWITGIPFVDSAITYGQSDLPETVKNDPARNTYFALPFLFGLLGLFYQSRKRTDDFIGLLALFIITGIGIIIYSNQPPREPRERDYVLVGSFFTYSIWIGMAVIALFEILKKRVKLSGTISAALAGLVILIAPILMGTQNYDDNSRMLTTGARDYANNFLQSCEENAIIFTYGDNDTYPLWYAQEVEGIRTDVRVVNLSLIAVDWYINLLRRKINDSPAIDFTIDQEDLRGRKRIQVLYYGDGQNDPEMSASDFLKFIGDDHPLPLQDGSKTESYMPTKNVYLPVNRQQMLSSGMVGIEDTANIVSRIPFNLSNKNYIFKDDLAVMDIITSNFGKRPIYFAVTCRPEKFLGLQNYMQLEGLSLKLVPVRSTSDPVYSIVGYGRVDEDKVYENVMNDFKWGNFDKYDLFVDDSYAPSIQSHQLAIRRAAVAFINKGENDKAVGLLDKYFASFPHMNFPYDYRAMYMIQVYVQAGAYDKAKPHMEILARETEDHLNFFTSLDPDLIETSFRQDFSLYMSVKDDLMRTVEAQGDQDFLAELKSIFAAYDLQPTENNLGF
ncbi:MAG: DUF2723 domain-containing protein [Bacteroidota bacterium]